MSPLGRLLRAFDRRRAFTFLMFSVVLGLCAGVAAAGSYPHSRTGWLIGLGVGGGSGGIKVEGESSDRTGGTGAFFRAGYGFNDRMSLEANSNLWTKEEDGATLTFSSTTAALNFYPGSSGLVLRGGIGFGSAEATLSSGSVSVTASESGLALNGGAAYEFRLRRTFALGPQIDFGWTTLDSFDANWINFGLGVTWYFVPN